MKLQNVIYNTVGRINEVMVSMFAESEVDRGFELQAGQTERL